MRRIVVISLGVFSVWLAGCVAETGPVQAPDTDQTAGEEVASSTESTGSPAADAQRARSQAGVGTTDQSLRIDTRPPPQPYVQPEAPPTPSDGK